jgi:glycopeptide antibiotics resistance protein
MVKKTLSLFKKEGYQKYIPGIAWFLLTLTAIGIPGKDLPKFGEWYNQISFDKLIHSFLFGMLAVFFMLPVAFSDKTSKQKKQWYFKIALAAAIWGFTAEVIQKYFIPGRSYDIVDVLANTVGVIAAYLIFNFWRAKTGDNLA